MPRTSRKKERERKEHNGTQKVEWRGRGDASRLFHPLFQSSSSRLFRGTGGKDVDQGFCEPLFRLCDPGRELLHFPAIPQQFVPRLWSFIRIFPAVYRCAFAVPWFSSRILSQVLPSSRLQGTSNIHPENHLEWIFPRSEIEIFFRRWICTFLLAKRLPLSWLVQFHLIPDSILGPKWNKKEGWEINYCPILPCNRETIFGYHHFVRSNLPKIYFLIFFSYRAVPEALIFFLKIFAFSSN